VYGHGLQIRAIQTERVVANPSGRGYRQTGDWNTASNRAGFAFSTTINFDWGGSKTPKNGVEEQEPIVKQNSLKGSSGPANAIAKAKNEKNRAQAILNKESSEQDNNYNFFYKFKDQSLRFSAEHLADGGPSANTIVINSHGSEKQYLLTPLGSMYPKDLHNYLLKRNNTYRDSYMNGTEITVRLEACYAGKQFAGDFSNYNPNMTVVGPSDAIMNIGMVYNFVINGGTYYYYQNGILLNINPEKK
jgi:hypothetical protein